MEQIPEFWRTEVFHPLSVHFPIALLAVALFFKLISLGSKKEVWSHGGTILLLLGVVGLWVAVYTGNLADGIVSRVICDPTILKDHQNLAWLSGWLFSAGLVMDLARYLDFRIVQTRLFKVLLLLVLAGGTGVLMYTGHLGATLVYQQAAGVYIPAEDCAEFE